jgi:hypothetical protein
LNLKINSKMINGINKIFMINEFTTLFKMNLCIDHNFFELNNELKKEKKGEDLQIYSDI